MTEQQARDFAAALGAEITYWRRRRGLSRTQLADKAGISTTTLGRIERADANAAAATADIWRIAKVLDISFSFIVRRAEDAQNQLSRNLGPVEVTDEESFNPRGGSTA